MHQSGQRSRNWPTTSVDGEMPDMSEPIEVDIFADPGLPSRLVERFLNWVAQDGRYSFRHNRQQIPLRDDGTLDLESVRSWSQEHGVDATVIVTEIPRTAGHRPKMTAMHPADSLVIISLPALGWFNLTKRLRGVILESLDVAVRTDGTEDELPDLDCGVVHTQGSGSEESYYVASPWWWSGRARLVLGMVRTNEPLATAPKLSGAFAAASATGAFGIFFSSIWKMADALPTWRLGLISVMTIVVMVGWLTVGNGLWERRHSANSLREANMYNASTLVTLAASVSLLYLALFLGIFTAALVVIDASFMTETIGRQSSVRNYLNIAWLSASMGTVAGALGSSFDSDVDLRELTHGRRQMMRYWERSDG